MSSPRVLTIMGSGETAPTMAKVHRRLLERLPADAVAAILDTPYGFQENADEITAKTLAYFRATSSRSFTVARLRTPGEGRLEVETAISRARQATLLFAGPGSPSYALRVWRTVPAVREILAEKLARGGMITLASAAALTTGAFTLPVYEIYKAGEDPSWLPGLDLLSAYGLPVAVVPHYDNAEGGTHDTRFCYMGERRLRRLEAMLPPEVFIVGVDGHTALVLDFDLGEASVLGVGGVTVRRDGKDERWESGSSFPIDELRRAAERLRSGSAASHGAAPDPSAPGPAREPASTPDDIAAARSAEAASLVVAAHAETAPSGSPFATEVDAHCAAFDALTAAGDIPGAVSAVLELDAAILAWSRDSEESEEPEIARGSLRSMIVRLGELAGGDEHLRASVVAPLVETLLDLRERARSSQDWQTADLVRDRLVAAGVELHDTPQGTSWEIRPDR